MAILSRQREILSLLKENKSITVKQMAKELYVSEATIRRDLTELEKLGLLTRCHGGAILADNSNEVSIYVRMGNNAKFKQQVVNTALSHIPQFNSVFIDSSSTALALAERMDLSNKTVVTNNLQTAIQLSKKPNVNLIILGGNVYFNTLSATGGWTVKQLDDFYFDLMICSCAAIIEEGVYERSLEQKQIKQTALSRSKKKILLFDHTKLNAEGRYRCSTLDNYDLVITDICPPDFLLQKNIPFIY